MTSKSDSQQGYVLPEDWFQRDTITVALELIGTHLIIREENGMYSRVRIVETEAYLAEGDAACHAATRMTSRNKPMFDDGGILYVYNIYGVHKCANIVTETAGRGCAVLLRAAECIEGVELMLQRRGNKPEHDLLRGPGNLARALGLDLSYNRLSCASVNMWIEDRGEQHTIFTTPRIGITKSRELPLRFYSAGSRAVSATR